MQTINIIKIEDGFKFSIMKFEFNNSSEIEILSDTTCHIPTNKGLIFFDTSVTIEGQSFETIEEWITELYK